MKLPPLNALKAFEAAARTGSFTAAAAELGVSSTAVSLQVRNLEQFLNRQLFLRNHNQISLTDAGTSVYVSSAAALNTIAGMTTRLLEGEVRQSVVISVLPALAERWLAPALSGFANAHPEIGIEIRVEEDPVDLVGSGVDLRLCYGNDLYKELHCEVLFDDAVTPLYAPALTPWLEGGLAQLPDALLIHVDWGPGFALQPGWRDWFAHQRIDRSPDWRRGIKVASSSLALQLAQQGAGVVLGQLQLAHKAITNGVLLAQSSQTLPLGKPYFAVTAHAKSTYKPLQTVCRWIRQYALGL